MKNIILKRAHYNMKDKKLHDQGLFFSSRRPMMIN